MRTILLALGTALVLTLSGCHDQNVKQESAPVASAAVGAEMCVTNAGSCPIFGTRNPAATVGATTVTTCAAVTRNSSNTKIAAEVRAPV